ncbi:MAG: sulfatase-like hydrolase/transferase, partial [Planctomycetaceae bacterium]
MARARLWAMLLVLAAPGANAADQRPNILFVFSDDHCEQALSAYDADRITTPNLDRIAEEGLRFARCDVTNAVCDPVKDHRERARQYVNARYGTDGCTMYREFLDVLARDDVATAIVTVCLRIPSRDGQADPVIRVYRKADAQQRAAMLSVIGRIGGARALGLIQQEIGSSDAAPCFRCGMAALHASCGPTINILPCTIDILPEPLKRMPRPATTGLRPRPSARGGGSCLSDPRHT